MKKLFGILVIMILSATFSYTQNSTDYDKKLTYNQTVLEYTGKASDTIGTATTSWTFTTLKRSYYPVMIYVDIALDSIGGTSDTVYVKLQHKRFSDLSYTTIDSAIWYGSSDDTVISFSPTAQSYTFTQTGGDTLVSQAKIDVFNADSTISISADTAVFNAISYDLTVIESNQVGLSGYFRVYISCSTTNILEAKIDRLNIMFLKPE